MKNIIFDLDGTLVQLKPNLVCFADIDRLALLRKQYNFALVTGSNRAEVIWALTETKLRALFDDRFVVAFEDTNSEKSSGKPFLEICSRLQGERVMIGDSTSDETGSAIAGLPFVRVKSHTALIEQRQELDEVINRAVAIIEQSAKLLQ